MTKLIRMAFLFSVIVCARLSWAQSPTPSGGYKLAQAGAGQEQFQKNVEYQNGFHPPGKSGSPIIVKGSIHTKDGHGLCSPTDITIYKLDAKANLIDILTVRAHQGNFSFDNGFPAGKYVLKAICKSLTSEKAIDLKADDDSQEFNLLLE